MKKIILFLILIPLLTIAQNKSCDYAIEEVTDSTSLKVLPEKMVYENIFGSSKELVQFTLFNQNGLPTLELQVIKSSQNFLPIVCFTDLSKIVFQLNDGSVVNLLYINNKDCSSLNYNQGNKTYINILTGYFVFETKSFEALKKSPISIMRIQYDGQYKDYVINSKLNSEITRTTSSPSNFFIENLSCVE